MAAPKTLKMMNEMVAFAREGNLVYPMMWQPLMGTNATVGAAVRTALKQNLLEVDSVDGNGKPRYRATLPAATHAAPATLN